MEISIYCSYFLRHVHFDKDHVAVLTAKGELLIETEGILHKISRLNRRPFRVVDFVIGMITDNEVKLLLLDRIGAVFETILSLPQINNTTQLTFRRIPNMSEVRKLRNYYNLHDEHAFFHQ
jgi:hypothetical protein